MMKFIEARFDSRCAETGKAIRKNESILYNTQSKKVYYSQSKTYKDEAEARCMATQYEEKESTYYATSA